MTGLTILDGGMGRQLEDMGAPFRRPEWSALALMEAPDYVIKAHLDFIAAGAQIITTNSYAVVPHHIGEERFQNRGAELIKIAAECAVKAVQQSGKDVRIAGCVPPLFGSYRPEHFKPEEAETILAPFIAEQEDVADIWLCETVSSLAEALFLLSRLKNKDKPVWISFTLDEHSAHPVLRSGEDIDLALRVARDFDVEAVLFNCNHPTVAMLGIEKALATETPYKIGCYANRFQAKTEKRQPTNINAIDEEVTPMRYLDFAQQCVQAGVSIIGGCCGIGPDYIKLLTSLSLDKPVQTQDVS